jgi:hypothetical protein
VSVGRPVWIKKGDTHGGWFGGGSRAGARRLADRDARAGPRVEECARPMCGLGGRSAG